MRPLTQADRVAAFQAATRGFVRRLGARFESGMSDADLADALKDALGIFAGRCAPEQLHLTWQGAGLKIWASWHVHNHVREKPVFSGAETIAMAREVYGIPDPNNRQLPLL